MRKIFAGLFLFVTIMSQAQQVPVGFVLEEVAGGLNPTTMALAPDGRLFIAEKDGRVLVFNEGVLQEQPFLTLAVDNFNERGLSGIAFDPQFDINNFFYVYYTVPGENRNRLSRFIANGDFAIPGSEQVLLELDPLSGTIHNGGAMNFGLDGKLYLAVGDGANANDAQNLNSLAGKILRLNNDGTIPGDNPFFNSLTGVYRSIYALGLRNPFTFSIQPATGKILVNDVGQASFEEVNEIRSGGNYGWPIVEGFIGNQTPPENYEDPLHAYNHAVGCAIIGSAFYNPVNLKFPPEYHGKYFFADYCGGYINVLNPISGTVEQTFATNIDRPLAFVFDNEGDMYYLERAGQGGGSQGDNTGTQNGALWKVTYTGSGAPFIGRQPASILVPVGEDVNFEISASGQPTLNYQWQRNGNNIVGATSNTLVFESVVLSNDGDIFTCVVSNNEGSAVSEGAVLSVTTNNRPDPQIVSPGANNLYRAGDVLDYQGVSSDPEDGQLTSQNLTWRIDFHHNDHTHPALESVEGISGGSFVIPRIGETSDNVWYRIYLTASDSEGLTKTVFQDVFPEKSEVLVNSNPAGLSINLDGQNVATPFNFTGVQGITRTLEAPFFQEQNGVMYVFQNWSDGNENRIVSFNTPEVDSAVVANYAAFVPDEGDGLNGAYFSNVNRTFPAIPNLSRLDATIDFDWGNGSPDQSITADNFTARWTGFIKPVFGGLHRFYTQSDDGVRLWIDDQLVIDQWIPQAVTEWSGTFFMEREEMYSIRLEYFEEGGEAVVRLLWSNELISKEVVPSTQLFTSEIVGVNEVIDSDVRIYPNPTSDKVYISSVHQIREIRLTTLSGKEELFQSSNISGQVLLNLQHLSNGMYILSIKTDRNVSVSKLMIEH